MIVCRTIEEARRQIRRWKAEEKILGVCPTMGSLQINDLENEMRRGVCPTMGHLHEERLSLMKASVHDSDVTAASVLVNQLGAEILLSKSKQYPDPHNPAL